MNDRTQWDDPRGERGGSNYRQGSPRSNENPGRGYGNQQSQQDWDRQDRNRGGSGGGSRSWQQQQDWGGQNRQQGAWHDDDERRSGSYRGNEWRGERDWGSPSYGQGQQQQREWRGSAEREGFGGGSYGSTYGGNSYGGGSEMSRDRSWEQDSGDYGYAERAWGGSSDRYRSRPTSSGSMHRDEIGHRDEMGETTRMRQDREMRERQDLSGRDVGGRRGQDWYAQDTGQAGSQSFAAGYGMSSGANYDQWGGPEQRRGIGQSWGHSGSSEPTFGRGYGPDYGRSGSSSGDRSSGGGQSRGFFERAGDEIASWFGDEDAARRREEDYRGHGPSDYTRSDERIREDVNDRLTDDPRVDARRISVSVDKGEVTLSGTVGSRDAKRRAEDCIDRISGVKHVQNNLRVDDRNHSSGSGSTSWTAGEAATHSGSSNLGGGSGAGSGSASTIGSASGVSSGTGGLSGSQGTSGSGGSATMGSGSSGAAGSSTTTPGATGGSAGAGSGGSMTGASGSSEAGKTTPTSGGTSSQGASTGTTGSSGSGSSKT
jgi:hypothetical protein